MDAFTSYLERSRSRHGSKFDSSSLAPQFVPYFNTGERVEVALSYGEKKRGYIGVTTGWRPVFLLLARKNVSGSSTTLGKNDYVIRTIKGKYRR